jgi:oxygen-dependent protoporphyrinogen oxidase
MIRTERVNGFIIDAGPDTLLAHKPAALALTRAAGLDSELVAPSADRTTFVLRGSALRSLPQTSAMGLPTDLKTLLAAGAFSWRGKLRMAAEPFVPPRRDVGDESVGSFVKRRFGSEAVNYVAEPVLAGLHRGDVMRLSMHALFPFLADAERKQGSVARAWRQAPRSGGTGSMSLRRGLGDLPAQLRRQLPEDVVVTGSAIRQIERADMFRLYTQDGLEVRARAVVLSTPGYDVAMLTASLDAELTALCRAIRYLPTVNVALGYRRDDVRHPLRGWGFVVPGPQGRLVRSVSWVSSKWPDRAPAGHVLLRVAVTPAAASDAELNDPAMVVAVHDELCELLGIAGAPVLSRVYRVPKAMPQLEVGHLVRMAAIDRRLSTVPGLFVSASGFRGVGLADCIGDAQRVSEQVAAFLNAA